MNEKLLCKPPFRYLHDIYTATLAKTGFGDGLFSGEELNSKGFEDKDSKLAWLNKLIALVELIMEQKVDLKPSMVLAGQQPEKTNLFLQQMFQCATAGIDTTPLVQHILGGGVPDAEEDRGGDEAAAA
jgi:TRAF3-interacting protein 1